MTLLEYITDLQSQGLSGEEIFAKAQEFKGRTKPEEVVEEVKTEVVVDQTGATAATTPENASEIQDTELESEDGSLDLQEISQPYYVLSSDKTVDNTFDIINQRADRFKNEKDLTAYYLEKSKKDREQKQNIVEAEPIDDSTKELDDFDLYKQAVRPSSEDLLKIQNDVSLIDLNPFIETKTIGDKFGRQSFEVTNFPFEKQRKEAEELLKKEGKEINEQSIQDQTRILITDNKRTQLKRDRTKDYLKNLPENKKNLLFSDIDKERLKLDYGIMEEAELVNTMVDQLEDEETALNKNLASIVDALEDPEFKFDLTYAKENNIPVLTLKDGRKIPANVIDRYKDLVEIKVQAASDIKNQANKLSKDQEEYKELYSDLDLVRRNYSLLEKVAQSASNSIVSDLVLGTEISAIDLLLFAGEGDGYDSKVEIDLKKRKEKLNSVRNKLQKDFANDFSYSPIFGEDAFESPKKFGEFFAVNMAGQTGTLMALSMGRPGLYGFAASTYGRSISDLEIANEEQGTYIGNIEKRITALGYSSAEVLLGTIPTYRLLGRAKDAFSKNDNFIKGSYDYFKKNWDVLPSSALIEGGSEAATGIAINGIDIIRGEKNISQIYEGVDEQFVVGGMFGPTISAAPFMKGLVLSSMSDYNALSNWRSNEEAIKILNNEVDGIDKRTKEYKSRIALINDLTQSNSDILDNALNDINNNLTKDGFERYKLLTRDQETLRILANNIENNKSLSSGEKAQKLDVLNSKFDIIQSQREIYKKDFTNVFNIESKGVQNFWKQKAKQELGGEGSKETIKNKATELYRKDKIKKSNDSALKVVDILGKAGVNISYAYETDNKTLLENVKTILDTRLEEKSITQEYYDQSLKEITEGINNGEINGANVQYIKDGKTGYDIFVSETNALKNTKTETGVHEIGHTIFIEGLKQNPEAYYEFAENVLTYLKENNTAAYNRITTATQGQTKDEVLMNFLEEVSSGRLELEANNKSKGFLASIGLDLGKIFSRSSNTDNTYYFKNSQDVNQFLTTLGNKIKNGTLTISDIKDIQEKGIAGKKGKKIELPKVSLSQTASNKVQEIYDAKGKDGAFEIIQQYEGMANKIANKYQDVPGFDRQLLVDEILTGKRGVIDMINEYDPSTNVPVAAYINKYLRSRSIEAANRILKQEFETDVTEARGVIAEETKEPETVSKKAQTPRATNQFTTSFYEGLKIETKGKSIAEINEEVNKQFDKAIESDLEALGSITSFGQTKNIGPAVAALMEKATGMPAKVFTDKSKNIAKKDAKSGALTNVKQFLNKNAQRDFKNLPDAFAKDSGKATFIPENVKKALYKKNDKGQFVLDKSKTLKDYKELLGDMQKPVYRASEAQTTKGLVGLSLRNMMFEKAVPSKQARSKTGVKFSKTISNKKATEALVFRGKNQELTMEKIQDLLSGKNWSELTKKEQVKEVLEAIKVLNKELGFDIATSVNLIERGDPDKAGSKKQLYVTNLAQTLNNKNISAQRKAEIKKQVENGELVDLSAIKDKSKVPLTNSDAARPQTTPSGKNKTKGQSIKSRIDTNLSNIKNITKAKENVFLNLLKVINKNPSLLGAINSLLYKVNNNSGAFRNMGTLIGMIQQKGYNQNITVGEHVLQYNEMINLLEVAGITMNPALFKDMSKWLAENYIQVQSTNNTKKDGKKIGSKSGSGIAIQEINHPAGSKNLFTGKNDLSAWNAKVSMLPVLLQQITEARNGERAWKDVGSTLSKYFSPYGYYNANTFKISDVNGELVSIAEVFGAKIPKKYQGTDSDGNANFPNVVQKQAEILSQTLLKQITIAEGQKLMDAYINSIAETQQKAGELNSKTFKDKTNKNMTITEQVNVLENYDNTLKFSRSLNTKPKGISVFDFDDTLAQTKSKVIVTMPDGVKTKIDATEFAAQSFNLEQEGAKFNFDEFNKVVDGKKGPLADLALKRQDKFGSGDIFVLTARPQAAAQGIKTFLDGIGLNLPLKNITGLADGTPEAKANWIISKTAEGYNNFYFADDAIKNVKAVKEVLDQVDVKSKVQIAKFSKTKTFNKIFNDILESSTGIESYKEYSAARAQTVGASKGKFTFFNTPSAEDFTGLLYKTLGKGKVGDAQMAFYKTNLLDPYNRAELAVTKAKITAANDFKALKRNLKTLPKSLSKQTGIGGFTFSQAARVAAWTRQDMNIPGLSKRDIRELNDFVNKNKELNIFVNELISIQKGKPYPKPGKNWLGGTITSDILNEINKVNRKAYLQEWQENVDIIFSDKNMNKLEAAYGPNYVEALRDQLARMKSGSNRPIGGSRVVNNVLDWLNNSVGAVMFLNTRSAVLQTLSSVNFINFGNNNIYKAGKAFANQPQFWKDFKTLMNSPYLVERRNGLKINVSESEIADAVAEASNKPKAAISYLLNKGFIFTRIADSFAIAAGGSTFYRNQIDAYVKDGMDVKEAEKRAFDDFYAIAEENQQSSNPSKISQQQASGAGRVILAFANTPMQYARIIKRSSQDLINKRGDWKSNVSKIVFYAAIQNIAFNALQSALFADAFGEEEDDEKQDKTGRIANGMADSLLRGLGIQGAAVSALKNSLLTIANENDKKSPKFVKAVYDLFDFSPPIDSKFRKLRSGANTITWERENIKNKGFDLNNPAYLAGAQVISGLTNIPMDRAIQKINNIRAITSNSSQNWQKVAMALGWSTWDVGLPYYGVDDKVEMTPQMILKEKVTTMKKETSTKQQKEMLLKLGLTKQQIKALKYEEARVKKIIELQNKKK